MINFDVRWTDCFIRWRPTIRRVRAGVLRPARHGVCWEVSIAKFSILSSWNWSASYSRYQLRAEGLAYEAASG